MATFNQKIDEDIRGAFRRLGASMVAHGKQAGENARMKFWAALGDANAKGQLDFNFMLNDLHTHYAFFCGRMQYEQTAKSLIDFIGVLSQKSEFDAKQLLAMMGGRANPMAMNSPDDEEIDAAFAKIVNNEVQGNDIPVIVDQITKWAKDNNNKAVIFEHMRLVAQQMPQLLDRAEWAKLLPFLDRYLSDQELNTHLTTTARNMLRTRAVQEYSNASVDGDAPKTIDKTGNEVSEEVDRNTARPDPVSKNPARNFSEPIVPPTKGTYETVTVIFHRLAHFRIGNDQLDKIKNGVPITPNELYALATSGCNAVAANILAWMIRWPGITQNTMVKILNDAAQSVNKTYSASFSKAIYDHLSKGGNVDAVTEEFNHTFNITETNRHFAAHILQSVSAEYGKSRGRKAEDADDNSK